MSVVTKSDLVSKVAAATGNTRKDSELLLNTVLDTIAVEALAGNEVRIAGFGAFNLRRRGPRKINLPGSTTEATSRGVNLVGFKAYDKLRSYD